MLISSVIYQIICPQVQRNLNTYKWRVLGVLPIEILILIVFRHLEPLTTDHRRKHDLGQMRNNGGLNITRTIKIFASDWLDFDRQKPNCSSCKINSGAFACKVIKLLIIIIYVKMNLEFIFYNNFSITNWYRILIIWTTVS